MTTVWSWIDLVLLTIFWIFFLDAFQRISGEKKSHCIALYRNTTSMHAAVLRDALPPANIFFIERFLGSQPKQVLLTRLVMPPRRGLRF